MAGQSNVLCQRGRLRRASRTRRAKSACSAARPQTRRVAARDDAPGDAHGARASRPIPTSCSPARMTACIAAPIAARPSSAPTFPTRARRSGRSWSMPATRSGLCRRLAGRRVSQRGQRRELAAAARSQHADAPRACRSPCRVMRMAQHPTQARHDLRGARGGRRDAHHRWRRDAGRIAAPT